VAARFGFGSFATAARFAAASSRSNATLSV